MASIPACLRPGAARGRPRPRAQPCRGRAGARRTPSRRRRRPEERPFERGFFFEPTLIDGADNDALVMTQESYGPIAAVRRVSDDAEALAVANALPFGLAAYVYSRDLEALGVRRTSGSGAVGVNVNDTTELQAPFGGWKLSGLGRELGREGLMAFRETKHMGTSGALGRSSVNRRSAPAM